MSKIISLITNFLNRINKFIWRIIIFFPNLSKLIKSIILMIFPKNIVWKKQIIERFNRTLKYYYRPKAGFSSLDNANSYMVLFASYSNFLGPNKALD